MRLRVVSTRMREVKWPQESLTERAVRVDQRLSSVGVVLVLSL